jgi:hypothetical protein
LEAVWAKFGACNQQAQETDKDFRHMQAVYDLLHIFRSSYKIHLDHTTILPYSARKAGEKAGKPAFFGVFSPAAQRSDGGKSGGKKSFFTSLPAAQKNILTEAQKNIAFYRR